MHARGVGRHVFACVRKRPGLGWHRRVCQQEQPGQCAYESSKLLISSRAKSPTGRKLAAIPDRFISTRPTRTPERLIPLNHSCSAPERCLPEHRVTRIARNFRTQWRPTRTESGSLESHSCAASKSLAVSEAGAKPLLPTTFTVATGDYLLSRRLFLYTPADPQNKWTRKFVEFALPKLEVFSWWTSGGEAAALDALFNNYKKRYPGVGIINATVAGGSGSGARPVLQTRLAVNNPPDTWQSHPGWELLGDYVEPGYCEPITDLYQSDGWEKAFPKALVNMVSQDGKAYAVLTGVHHGNVLWYNKKLLEKNGIKVGDTMTFDQFFAICDKLKAAGIPALGVGDSGIWASSQLFENTLLGVVGPQGWTDLFSGKLKWDDPKVKQAMQYFAKMQDYLNPDHASLTWDQAVKELMEGKVAFNSMGDWADGEFIKAKMKENEDFGWVNHPGTSGSFIIVADGFTLAKGAPHKEAAIAWLKSIGSKEAQEAFNPLKGSIPARTDVDKSKFDGYHRWSMDEFAKDRLVASCVHGGAAPAAFQQALRRGGNVFRRGQECREFRHRACPGGEKSRPEHHGKAPVLGANN